MSSRLLPLIAVGTFLAASGCASGPAPLPTVSTGPDAEVSIDGLYRVDNSIMQLAYAKPDLDLSPYTALMLDPVSVAYQENPGPGADFELTKRQMETLKEIFQTEVVKALTEDDGYELVSEPAPNVLEVTTYLVDLVVRVPTERTGGRNRNFAVSYGEVTLIIELRDSQSREILARVGDRRDPTRSPGELVEVSPTFVRSDVTRMFRQWATFMRERLDQIRAVEM